MYMHTDRSTQARPHKLKIKIRYRVVLQVHMCIHVRILSTNTTIHFSQENTKTLQNNNNSCFISRMKEEEINQAIIFGVKSEEIQLKIPSFVHT